MKKFSRTSLPEVIRYNNKTYKVNISLSTDYMLKHNPVLPKDAIIVEVLSRRLRGKIDFHGKPYTPSSFIFTVVETI